MIISTRGRYGLRVLLDVALHQAGGPVALSDIARRQGISQKYLWQVVNPLKAAGILRSVRGARGGYALAMPPERITIYDLVTVLEGAVALVPGGEGSASSAAGITRTARDAWREIEAALCAAMQKISLKDLLTRHREAENREASSYVI